MQTNSPLRRRQPQPEPGPRLLPIVAVIAIAGFCLGAGGKLLFAHFRHPAKTVVPQATPSPNYAHLAIAVQATHLPPIPTPEGTWSAVATMTPFRVVVSPSVHGIVRVTPRPHHESQHAPTPRPVVTPEATVQPESTVQPPVPRPTATAKVKKVVKLLHHHVVAAVVHASAAPAAFVTAAPVEQTIASSEPTVVATPRPPGAERVVRRYLSSLIHGDEATAYALLGAAPGDRNVSLSEESFINTGAHISAINSSSDANGSVVHAEITAPSGLYFATYHLSEREGKLLIDSHEFIKP